MTYPSRETVYLIRKTYPVGTRIKLTKMDDPQAPPVGTEGTVIGVDDLGQLIVNWDSGSSLNVVYGVDRVEIISLPEGEY